MEVQLSAIHWVYVALVVVVLGTMVARRDTLLPCIIGLFIIGYMYHGTIVGALQVLYNALLTAGTEFLGIITIISLVVAFSKALADLGSDFLVVKPATKFIINADIAYWVLGIVMLIISWFVWPSPAVALVGALLVPVAVRAGLPAIACAMAMNLFGHGIGLSTDPVIQGAPAIFASFAGLPDASYVTSSGIPLFLVMSITTAVAAYVFIKRDLAKNKAQYDAEKQSMEEAAGTVETRTYSTAAKIIAIATPLGFLGAIVAMIKFNLKGGDATALVGGVALALTSLAAVLEFKGQALEKITGYVRDGFVFGIQVFAPVIVIGAFFFLGAEGTAQAILGENATGFLMDFASWLAGNVPLSTIPVVFMEMLVGIICGLDGSGFAPLPLTGSIAQTLGSAIGADVAALAALGQIAGVWTGGGTIIPWGLIPVAAICGVPPMEMVRRNFWPVMIGFLATFLTAIIIL